LGPVKLIGETSSVIDATNCPGVVGPRNLRGQSADVNRGNFYTLYYQVTTCGATWPVVSGVWADWDNSGGPYNTSELVAPFSFIQTGQVAITFTVPPTAYLGNISIRVQVQETFGYSIDPCSQFPYGGTKDFSLIIKPSNGSYCQSGPQTLGTTALGPVSLVGIKQNINDQSGCPGTIGPQVLTDQIADMIIGNAYNLTYQVLSCTSQQNAVISTAWIDWNQDFQFSSWEQIAFQSTNFGIISSYFKAPVSTPTEEVKVGKTRLRVQVQETVKTPLDPCEKFSVGGTKDFSILVSASSK